MECLAESEHTLLGYRSPLRPFSMKITFLFINHRNERQTVFFRIKVIE